MRRPDHSGQPLADRLSDGLHLVPRRQLFLRRIDRRLDRLLLRSGDRDGGLKLLEDLREQPRGRGEDEDAWFVGTRILGEMYLDELGRPDLAVGCFSDYRDYSRSGADTLYLLGRAYEASGNAPAAIRAYDAVAGFTSHPRRWDAENAARRLREGPAA